MIGFIVGVIALIIFFYIAFVQQRRIKKIKGNLDKINYLLSKNPKPNKTH